MFTKNYYNYLINFFLFINLLLPKFIFAKIIFFIIFFSYFFNSTKIIYKRYLIFILIYLYSIIIATLRNDIDTNILFQFINFALILSLINPIVAYQLDIEKTILYSSLFISFVNILLLLSSFGILDTNIFNLVLNYNSFAVGARSFDDTQANLLAFATLGTTPIVTLAYFISFKKMKIPLILLFGIVIFLSSSRAMILTATFILIYFIFKKFNLFFKIFFTSISLLISIYYFNTINFFSTDEFGNNTRIGHYIGFLNYINPVNFIFGSGLTSSYKSDSYGITNHTEITILDDIRYFGFPLTLIVYLIYIFPSLKMSLSKQFKSDHFYFFIIYLLMSLTNPILTNSMGAIVILWYWSESLNKNNYEV